jgi:PIN domain nuclease of toxin-antitoxin system
VLDASAFLAYLRDETGAEIVENALIDGCYISIINWVEVLSKVVDLGESLEEIIKLLRDEGLLENSLEIIACKEEDAITILSVFW